VGDEVVFNESIHIQVLDVEGRAVTRVRVRVEHPSPAPDDVDPGPDSDTH
jgi:sRNA-binding carbon storage regulator CsrA